MENRAFAAVAAARVTVVVAPFSNVPPPLTILVVPLGMTLQVKPETRPAGTVRLIVAEHSRVLPLSAFVRERDDASTVVVPGPKATPEGNFVATAVMITPLE